MSATPQQTLWAAKRLAEANNMFIATVTQDGADAYVLYRRAGPGEMRPTRIARRKRPADVLDLVESLTTKATA